MNVNVGKETKASYNRRVIARAVKANTQYTTARTKALDTLKRFKDVGRNQPCPCGSSKKYKRCCIVDTYVPKYSECQ